jgi:phosphotransferase system HPr-like phosphotransfer protein
VVIGRQTGSQSLEASAGSQVIIQAEGSDAEAAAKQLAAFIREIS